MPHLAVRWTLSEAMDPRVSHQLCCRCLKAFVVGVASRQTPEIPQSCGTPDKPVHMQVCLVTLCPLQASEMALLAVTIVHELRWYRQVLPQLLTYAGRAATA